jgi:hypothetical protein
MDKSLFYLTLILNGDDWGSLAECLDVTAEDCSDKANERNGFEFNQIEIEKMKEKFSLSPEQVDDIFFGRMVS